MRRLFGAAMRYGRIKFSLRACLAFVAVIAITAYLGSLARRHQAATEQFEQASAFHAIRRISSDQLLDEACRLRETEQKLPWLSDSAVAQRHRSRLEVILERQSALKPMLWPEGIEENRKTIQRINRELLKLGVGSDRSE